MELFLEEAIVSPKWRVPGLGKPKQFMSVAPVGTIPKGEAKAFEVEGKTIAVARIDDSYYAFDDACTHMQCSLAKGFFRGATVVCPCHVSEFDMTSGEVLKGPAKKSVTSYQVRVQDGSIQVEV